jgi:hypothetical protein
MSFYLIGPLVTLILVGSISSWGFKISPTETRYAVYLFPISDHIPNAPIPYSG